MRIEIRIYIIKITVAELMLLIEYLTVHFEVRNILCCYDIPHVISVMIVLQAPMEETEGGEAPADAPTEAPMDQ